jgi:hypothetical protein
MIAHFILNWDKECSPTRLDPSGGFVASCRIVRKLVEIAVENSAPHTA